MKIFTNTLEFKRENGVYVASICCIQGNLNDVNQSGNSLLSAHELETAAAMLTDKRRLTYLLGRMSANKAINALIPSSVSKSFEVRSGIFGQPIVAHQGRSPIGVSIAHTDDCAVAVAFPSEHPLGIDLEEINPGNTKHVLQELTRTELDLLPTIFSSSEEAVGAAVFWTVKEAMAKCIKTGLMTPLTVFQIEDIKKVDDAYVSTFTNFGQYKAQSYRFNSSILTLVMPKNSALKNTSSEPFTFGDSPS